LRDWRSRAADATPDVAERNEPSVRMRGPILAQCFEVRKIPRLGGRLAAIGAVGPSCAHSNFPEGADVLDRIVMAADIVALVIDGGDAGKNRFRGSVPRAAVHVAGPHGLSVFGGQRKIALF